MRPAALAQLALGIAAGDPSGRQLRIFERGSLEEERVIADLRRAGVEVSREQERFALAGGWLRGKIDAIGRGFLEAPKAEHVVEIKSMSASTGARCRSTD